jgi:hypothetical protein
MGGFPEGITNLGKKKSTKYREIQFVLIQSHKKYIYGRNVNNN